MARHPAAILARGAPAGFVRPLDAQRLPQLRGRDFHHPRRLRLGSARALRRRPARDPALLRPPALPGGRRGPPRRRALDSRLKAKGNTVAGVKISNPDRLVDPASKATKIDLARYYDRIAKHMLPHLVGRPIALVRAPAGVEGKLFFQKHGDTVKVPGIKVLDRKYWPGHDPMLEIDTREALVAAAQMNVIEFHTWNSTTRAIAKPDRMLFDLDPGEGITWDQLLEATELTQRMLDMLGLESFLKTSGGKGLHVVVPLTPKDDYDTVKDFSQAVVVHLARTLPNLFVSKSGPRNRIGRIFIDYLRNGNGATTAAAFTARARPGLGVSVPVKWSELSGLESAAQWDIFSVHERLAKLRADPWRDYAKTRQTLQAASKRLRAAT
ncbi:MAG: hypothetical protein H7Y14_03910 [Burkholderiales bacterium]|nr:hypothetical protein [Burkholderiales bacterium]